MDVEVRRGVLGRVYEVVDPLHLSAADRILKVPAEVAVLRLSVRSRFTAGLAQVDTVAA